MAKTTLKERFDALEEKGETKVLRKMKGKDFREYRDDLKDFLKDFEVAARGKEENDILENEGFEGTKTVASIRLTLKNLRERVKAEKYHRTLRGRLRIKKPLTKEEKAGKKEETEREKAIELEKIEKMLKEVDIEAEKIKAKRTKEANLRYGSHETASSSRGILTDAVDEFRNALISPLLDSDVIELQRKRDRLEALEAVRKMHAVRGEEVKGVIEKAKRVIAGTATVAGEFVEETTGGVFKAVTLFLAWPIVLPVKLLNTAFAGAKYAFCFADGVLGFLDKGLDGLFLNLDRKEDGSIKVSVANALKGIPHVLIRGPILLVRGVCQGAAIGCRFLEKHIDADRWLKKSPVTAGFVLGGVGTLLLVGIVVASVFTLGIPIAALAGGLIAASIGAAVYGYFKGKAKKDELVSLKLSPSESSQLEKYENAHQHRKGQTLGPKEKEDETKKDEHAHPDQLERDLKDVHKALTQVPEIHSEQKEEDAHTLRFESKKKPKYEVHSVKKINPHKPHKKTE